MSERLPILPLGDVLRAAADAEAGPAESTESCSALR